MTNYDTAQQAQNVPIVDNRSWGPRNVQATLTMTSEEGSGVATGEITYEAVQATAPKENRVDLDDLKSEIEELSIVQSMINKWEAEEERIKNLIKARLGREGVGYLEGQAVWVHSPTEKFSTKQFQKAHPDLYDQFTRPRLVQELDTEELRKALPMVFEEFRVSSLRPLGPRS